MTMWWDFPPTVPLSLCSNQTLVLVRFRNPPKHFPNLSEFGSLYISTQAVLKKIKHLFNYYNQHVKLHVSWFPGCYVMSVISLLKALCISVAAARHGQRCEKAVRGSEEGVCLIVGGLKWSPDSDINMKLCRISGSGAPSSVEAGPHPTTKPLVFAGGQ